MKRNLLTVLFCAAIATGAIAQNQNAATTAKTEQQKLDALKGTYEIKANSRQMVSMPSNLADIIESNRKETETNTLQLNEFATLVIYPKSSIQNPKGNN